MQQINLYLPEFRPNREPLRAIHMLWAGLAFLILLICFSFYSNHKYKILLQQLDVEQKSQESIQAQLALLGAKKPAESSAEIDAKISQLQKSVERHQKILAMISHQDLGNDKGFSAQLVAMGQASLPTISVESFSLQRGGTYAELAGITRNADQIPLYLQRLRKDSSFSEVGFGVLNVERNSEESGLLKFSLTKAKNANNAREGGH